MTDTALTSRGIADAGTGVLLVAVVPKPSAGRIDLNVKVGTQPLGSREGLHHIKLSIEAGLAAGLWTRADVAAALQPALGDALPAKARP